MTGFPAGGRKPGDRSEGCPILSWRYYWKKQLIVNFLFRGYTKAECMCIRQERMSNVKC
jgi:hypothetical protein